MLWVFVKLLNVGVLIQISNSYVLCVLFEPFFYNSLIACNCNTRLLIFYKRTEVDCRLGKLNWGCLELYHFLGIGAVPRFVDLINSLKASNECLGWQGIVLNF